MASGTGVGPSSVRRKTSPCYLNGIEMLLPRERVGNQYRNPQKITAAGW